MSHINQINEINLRIEELSQERATALSSARAHEQAAREDILRAANAARERDALTVVLKNAQVVKATQDAQVAAQLAQKETEKALSRLAEKEKELDALILKHKENESDGSQQ